VLSRKRGSNKCDVSYCPTNSKIRSMYSVDVGRRISTRGYGAESLVIPASRSQDGGKTSIWSDVAQMKSESKELSHARPLYDACIRVKRQSFETRLIELHTRDGNTAKICSCTLCQSFALPLTDYSSHLDADMVVLRSRINQPACVGHTGSRGFYGCSTSYSERNKEYERTVCPYVTHGKLAPSEFSRVRVVECT
jgi:hypothetical protein